MVGGQLNFQLLYRCPHCAFGDVTAETSGFGDHPIFDTISLSADPFVDSANGDFTLNSNAAGLQCINSGVPNDIDQDGTTDNFFDLGAIQSDSQGANFAVLMSQGVLG